LEEADRVAALDAAVEHRIMEVIKDHEARLRAVEQWKWTQTGIHACVGILVVAFVGVCTANVTKQMERVQAAVSHQAPLPPAGGRGR
jgi:hypothetical protein